MGLFYNGPEHHTGLSTGLYRLLSVPVMHNEIIVNVYADIPSFTFIDNAADNDLGFTSSLLVTIFSSSVCQHSPQQWYNNAKLTADLEQLISLETDNG